MRILLDGYADVDFSSAQDLNARDLAIALSREGGHEVFLFVRDPGRTDKRLLDHRVELLPVGRSRVVAHSRSIWYKLTQGLDYIVTAKVNVSSAVFSVVRKLRRRRAVQIYLIESVMPVPPPFATRVYDLKARTIAKHSDFVLGISAMIASTASAWCGRSVGRVNGIGVDPDVFFPSAHTAEKAWDVACCGSLTGRKQPMVFVELAKRFSEYRFSWVGSGPLADEVNESAERGGVTNLRLLSSLTHPQLAEHLRSTRVFVLPSLHEGFPKVLLEAMACGVPCIAMSTYGPEVIEDGVSGFIVNGIEEMAERLEVLLTNDEVYTAFSERAQLRADTYPWSEVARGYDRLFREGIPS